MLGLWTPGLVESFPAHGRGVEWDLRVLLTQTILWSYSQLSVISRGIKVFVFLLASLPAAHPHHIHEDPVAFEFSTVSSAQDRAAGWGAVCEVKGGERQQTHMSLVSIVNEVEKVEAERGAIWQVVMAGTRALFWGWLQGLVMYWSQGYNFSQ